MIYYHNLIKYRLWRIGWPESDPRLLQSQKVKIFVFRVVGKTDHEHVYRLLHTELYTETQIL